MLMNSGNDLNYQAIVLEKNPTVPEERQQIPFACSVLTYKIHRHDKMDGEFR